MSLLPVRCDACGTRQQVDLARLATLACSCGSDDLNIDRGAPEGAPGREVSGSKEAADRSKTFDADDVAGQEKWISRLPKYVQPHVQRAEGTDADGNRVVILQADWGEGPNVFTDQPMTSDYANERLIRNLPLSSVDELQPGDRVVLDGAYRMQDIRTVDETGRKDTSGRRLPAGWEKVKILREGKRERIAKQALVDDMTLTVTQAFAIADEVIERYPSVVRQS